MPPKIAKLAGLGAFGACAGLLGVYLLVVFLSLPRPTGGIDWTNAAVAMIALAGVVFALIVLHVVIGRQLLQFARGERHTI